MEGQGQSGPILDQPGRQDRCEEQTGQDTCGSGAEANRRSDRETGEKRLGAKNTKSSRILLRLLCLFAAIPISFSLYSPPAPVSATDHLPKRGSRQLRKQIHIEDSARDFP